MSCFPEPHICITDKDKVVLDLPNYATKKELDHAADVNTFDLSVKKRFIVSEVKVDKLDINKLVNVPTNLNNLNTKEDDLDLGKLKTFPIDNNYWCGRKWSC